MSDHEESDAEILRDKKKRPREDAKTYILVILRNEEAAASPTVKIPSNLVKPRMIEWWMYRWEDEKTLPEHIKPFSDEEAEALDHESFVWWGESCDYNSDAKRDELGVMIYYHSVQIDMSNVEKTFQVMNFC